MSQYAGHGFHIHTILQGECMPRIAEVVRFWAVNVLHGFPESLVPWMRQAGGIPVCFADEADVLVYGDGRHFIAAPHTLNVFARVANTAKESLI